MIEEAEDPRYADLRRDLDKRRADELARLKKDNHMLAGLKELYDRHRLLTPLHRRPINNRIVLVNSVGV